MDELHSALSGQFRIDRELGGGGMWGAFGVYPAILRRLPLYAPYRDQPHFKRIVDNMIVHRKARG